MGSIPPGFILVMWPFAAMYWPLYSLVLWRQMIDRKEPSCYLSSDVVPVTFSDHSSFSVGLGDE